MGRDRHAGILLPLFAAPSSASWGIGELPDIVPLSRWLAMGGFDRLMLLPLGTMAVGQASPYSAQSAMAIDPIFIAVGDVEDFQRAGGVEALSDSARAQLQEAKSSSTVRHASVRRAKTEALDRAFDRFVRDEWARRSPRAMMLLDYVDRERWWLDDYVMFEAIAESMPGLTWREWPPSLRDRVPHALDEARDRFSRAVLRHQYLQWIAEEQWQRARQAARSHGVDVIGDFPFVVSTHSADVWARADEFLLDVSAGVPPDAFSATGQDWGLPTYRWDRIAETGFAWIRQRARRMAALFQGVRIDHLVGFYRTYGRPPHGDPFFTPGDEPTQQRQGEVILRIFLESGADVLAEDLGTVPDFVRASLASVGVPGSKVLRWERAWHSDDQPFLDADAYPGNSVAMTGTHDTEPLALWWDHAASDERTAFMRLPIFEAQGMADPTQPWSDQLRDLVITFAFATKSRLVLMPIQDLFGWRDRINTPATVGDWNWTWQLPWQADALVDTLPAMERAAFSQMLARRTMRD